MQGKASQRVWAIGYLAYVGLVVYFVAAYVGPGRWLAELQLQMWNTYYPVASVVVFTLPAVIAGRVAGRSMEGADLVGLVTGPRFKPYLRACVALAIAGVVATILARQAFSPDLGAMDVRRAADEPSGSFYAEVRGFAAERTMVITDRGAKTLYVALSGEHPVTGPVRLLVSGPEHLLQDRLAPLAPAPDGGPPQVAVRGLVDDKLSDRTRAWFTHGTGLALANDVRVLRPKIEAHRARIWLFGVLAAAIVIAGLLYRADRGGATEQE